MSELPKCGEEWFHKSHLTLAEVVDPNDSGEVWYQVPDIASSLRLPPDVFVFDYQRNEPITLELLERLGWKVSYATPECRAVGAAIQTPGGNYIDFRGDEGAFILHDHNQQELERLETPPTLRDLLATLRVFGVNQSSPDAEG